jgi:hypothetical protein
MSVGKRQWMRNSRLSRTIIHGMWFLAPLLLKPLVVNGFSRLSFALMELWTGIMQEYGVDYEEIFAPVAKMTTVRTILSIAASKGWPLH